MNIYDQVSNFFCDLYQFSSTRHLLLTTRARGQTAPLAAILAKRESEKATEMIELSAKLQELLNPEAYGEVYDTEQHEKSSALISTLASQLMDSVDLSRVVFGLIQAKEFLRRDVLMDSVAVELFDNHTHRDQLEKSAALFVKVIHLLQSPQLAGIEPDFSTVPTPWMRDADLKTDTTLQLYAFKQLSEKKTRLLEDLEAAPNSGLPQDEIKTSHSLFNKA